MRLLVVKLSALGDVIHALEALGRVRAAAPAALAVDWVVAPAYAPLLAGHPWLETVHPLDLRGLVLRGAWRRAWEAVGRLRQARYDAVVDLQGLFKSAIVARLAGARRRLGYGRGDDLGPWRGA
ncbi:MAG TPA: glycosyltransferase family 9 protein, partial [Thermodesulfobacteriota bacterium]|nr:glycosyltransferase family 9 protein [Thermodesulfobacteriota bacterium]